jgi:hypothetical protein
VARAAPFGERREHTAQGAQLVREIEVRILRVPDESTARVRAQVPLRWEASSVVEAKPSFGELRDFGFSTSRSVDESKRTRWLAATVILCSGANGHCDGSLRATDRPPDDWTQASGLRAWRQTT